MPIFEDGNRLTTQALAQLSENVDMLDCECPAHLIEILNKIRSFSSYTADCIERFPADRKTHQWLQQSADNLDALVSTTIVHLARIEGFIDDKNDFVARPKSK